jgi:hypothetical protein
LLSGNVDASMLIAPYTVNAKEAGFRDLVVFKDHNFVLPSGGIVARETPLLKIARVKMVVDTTGSSEAIARQTLSLYFDPDRGVVPKQAEIDMKGFHQVLQVMAEAGELHPSLPAAAG